MCAPPLAGIVAGRSGGRQGGPAAPAPRRARTAASLTPSDRPAGWLAWGEAIASSWRPAAEHCYFFVPAFTLS